MGRLYVVATPIGNLEDITFRALRILKEVDVIICEDTRVTSKLLNHYSIKKPLISCHQHSRIQKLDEISDRLNRGQNLALVSDAGTPGVSDPGNALVRHLLSQLNNAVEIVPLPGPSALLAAASVSGLKSDRFLFLGFLPHKKGRKKLYKRIVESPETVIIYESPHRLVKTLSRLNELISSDRIVIVFRELTKKFEERIEGSGSECLTYFNQNPDKVRGEFVIIISGC